MLLLARCRCFSIQVSCLPKVLRLVFVKLFWLMMCLVFERVSSPGNLYGVVSTVWLLRVILMFLSGGCSNSIVCSLMRFHVGVLYLVVVKIELYMH